MIYDKPDPRNLWTDGQNSVNHPHKSVSHGVRRIMTNSVQRSVSHIESCIRVSGRLTNWHGYYCFERLTHEMPVVRGQQHPFSTVNKLFLTQSKSFGKWQNPDGSRTQDPSITCRMLLPLSYGNETLSNVWFGILALAIYIFFVKANARNASRMEATAPIVPLKVGNGFVISSHTLLAEW